MSDITAVSPNAAVMAVSSMQQAGQQQQIELVVARKAMDIQAQGAMMLIDALPQMPSTLATSGTVGTRLNTWA